eukprot:350253-Rhodomonas_salina.1
MQQHYETGSCESVQSVTKQLWVHCLSDRHGGACCPGAGVQAHPDLHASGLQLLPPILNP